MTTDNADNNPYYWKNNAKKRPDFSATTVSINMADYQKLKKAEFAMKKEMERMAEMHWARTLQLTEKLATAERGEAYFRKRFLEYVKNFRVTNDRLVALQKDYDELTSSVLLAGKTYSTRERETVVRYLREFADSVAKLKPDEHLVMYGLYPGKKECDCGDSND